MKNMRMLPLLICSLFVFSCCNPQQSQNNNNKTDDNKYIYIGAINDFHGAIIEGDGGSTRMGLAKVGTILKELGSRDNTLTISQGDDWQGSIYSNFNRGQLINDAYSLAKLSARTVGNHDFDWGVDTVIANTARSYDGYKTPVLAANVYDFDFDNNTPGTTHQSDIGVKSVTYTLENGLKVGIVGIIGKDQLTSINSLFTREIVFKDHIQEIKQVASDLKHSQDCDVVIASCHTGQEDVKGCGLEEYVDLVLCGHTHKYEVSEENGVTYAQFDSYGSCVGYITLTYDGSDVTNTTVSSFTRDNFDTYFPSGIDSAFTTLINNYNTQCDSEANVTVATGVSGTFASGKEGANLMCKAVLDAAVAAGHSDVLLAYSNTARSTLYSGTWTYADLYRAFPFDNVVFIERVKGEDILSQCAQHNNICFNPTVAGTSGEVQINANQYYKIAVLDYLLYHIQVRDNDTRYYNYFYYFDGNPDSQLTNNYRVILKKWLLNNGTGLNSSNYSSSNAQFNRNRIVQAY